MSTRKTATKKLLRNNQPKKPVASYNNYSDNYFYRNYKKPYKYPGLGRQIGAGLGGALRLTMVIRVRCWNWCSCWTGWTCAI